MNISKKNTTKHILIWICALISCTLNAQEDTKIEHKIQVNTTLQIYSKLHLNGNRPKHFKSYYAPSAKIGTNYSFYYKNIIGFNSGIGLTIIPHIFRINQTLHYNFWSQEESYYAKEIISRYLHYAYTFPLNIEKRLILRKNNYINFNIGLELYYILNFPYSISTFAEIGPTQAPLFEYEINNAKSELFVAYITKVGYTKILKNFHTIGFNILLAYSPQLLGTGTFKIYDNYYPQEGTIKWDINHIGIEFIYGFKPISKKSLKKTQLNIKDIF